ncbi:Fic family protein [Halococcus sediminicola]|uniref:Fic family protein n=1 Tax=Halococcus sediminicola TaxID=1264579 RepID=UPI0006794520|nr:Fic family protein [Halococcus sediminicola]
MTENLPTPDEILAMHDEIEAEYDLKYKGVRAAAPKGKLRQNVIEPAREYDDPWHRAAVLLFGIQSVHVFEDANKRTAWAVTMEYLDEQGLDVELPQDTAVIERIVRRAGLFDTDALAEWLETGEIDESKLPER